MSVIDADVVVDVPLHAAYEQWTRVEEFPLFMREIEQVRRLDGTRLLWVGRIGGSCRQWSGRITATVPDRLVSWASDERIRHDGLVTLAPAGARRTRVTLRLDMALPDTAVPDTAERDRLAGSQDGTVPPWTRAQQDLWCFKEHVETRRGIPCEHPVDLPPVPGHTVGAGGSTASDRSTPVHDSTTGWVLGDRRWGRRPEDRGDDVSGATR